MIAAMPTAPLPFYPPPCYENELPQFILYKMVLSQDHFSLNPEP